MVEASPRRIFANAHTYHINSVSVNSDQQTFMSADDLRINLWHLEITDQSFSILLLTSYYTTLTYQTYTYSFTVLKLLLISWKFGILSFVFTSWFKLAGLLLMLTSNRRGCLHFLLLDRWKGIINPAIWLTVEIVGERKLNISHLGHSSLYYKKTHHIFRHRFVTENVNCLNIV